MSELSRDATLLLSLLPFISGATLKEKNLLPWEQLVSFKSRPYFERAALSRKENRNSQKLFPFVKMIESHVRVPRHIKNRHRDITHMYILKLMGNL